MTFRYALIDENDKVDNVILIDEEGLDEYELPERYKEMCDVTDYDCNRGYNYDRKNNEYKEPPNYTHSSKREKIKKQKQLESKVSELEERIRELER